MFQSKRLDTPLDKLTRRQAGRRSVTRTDRKRGRYIRSRPAGPKPDDIAFDATMRTAAIHQRRRRAEAEERGEETMALELRKQDLQRKVRVRRANNLILFVVDASWSMATAEGMEVRLGPVPIIGRLGRLPLSPLAWQRRRAARAASPERKERVRPDATATLRSLRQPRYFYQKTGQSQPVRTCVQHVRFR